MEFVLDIYKRPYDPDHSETCMNESPKQLISEGHLRKSMDLGYKTRVDYEYIRHEVVNIFISNEPLAEKRCTQVTEFKTMKYWEFFIKKVASENYSTDEKITPVMDNYKTQVPAALYEPFDPVEAKGLWDSFEFISTTKHGSWLNMA